MHADCLACGLADGTFNLPGGRIHETDSWIVEHCVGPLPVGTLIVKPRRHVEHVWELNFGETTELGPLLKLAADAVHSLVASDQVYVCLWSHSGWNPGHIHFVIQPAWNDDRSHSSRPGPYLQVAHFDRGIEPDRGQVEAITNRARQYFDVRIPS